jgi:hypothetical protein
LTAVYFQGNAPTVDLTAFWDDHAKVYYLPGMTGWGTTFAGLQTSEVSELLIWPPLQSITYGTQLGSNQFVTTSLTVPGSLSYSPPAGTVLSAGSNQLLTVTFTPDETNVYPIVSATNSLTVLPAPLTLNVNSTSRIYGAANPAFTGGLAGLQNSDNITAAFSSIATPASPIGTYPILPLLSDPGAKLGNYTVTTNSGTLTVGQAAPTMSWTNPAPITFGTPLGSAQLNATASVPGTFVYSPTNGTVLSAGTNQLNVIFTPTDATDYTTASAAVTLAVQPSSQNPSISMTAPIIFGNELLLGFSLSQGTVSSFTLLQTPNLTGPWTTNTSAVLTTNAQTGAYQFAIPVPDSLAFYQERSP